LKLLRLLCRQSRPRGRDPATPCRALGLLALLGRTFIGLGSVGLGFAQGFVGFNQGLDVNRRAAKRCDFRCGRIGRDRGGCGRSICGALVRRSSDRRIIGRRRRG
jgi:hypothetical protein